MPPATRPSCPSGPAGSGRASCATAPGGAARGRARAPAPRAAAVGHRHRLLPLDGDGRLPLRPRRVARPAGDGRELEELGVRADGLDLADGLAAVGELRGAARRGAARRRRPGRRVPRQTIRDKGMDVPMPIAFYDPTNPRTREFIWGGGQAQLPRPRRARVVAGRLRARDRTRRPRPTSSPRRSGRRGGRHLPARQRPHVRRGHGAAAGQDDAETVLLCRSAWAGQQRTAPPSGRATSPRPGTRCAAGTGGAEHRASPASHGGRPTSAGSTAATPATRTSANSSSAGSSTARSARSSACTATASRGRPRAGT